MQFGRSREGGPAQGVGGIPCDSLRKPRSLDGWGWTDPNALVSSVPELACALPPFSADRSSSAAPVQPESPRTPFLTAEEPGGNG